VPASTILLENVHVGHDGKASLPREGFAAASPEINHCGKSAVLILFCSNR
jgi:hypothetical protein